MLKVSWSQKICNAEVLQRADTCQDMMKSVIARQIRFVGHVLPEKSLENLVLTGKVEGHRACGRQRLTLLRWLEKATGIQPLDIIVTLTQRRQRRQHCRLRQNSGSAHRMNKYTASNDFKRQLRFSQLKDLMIKWTIAHMSALGQC